MCQFSYVQAVHTAREQACRAPSTRLATVNALTAGAIANGEVATLAHELWNDSVEERSLEVEWLAAGPDAFLPSAQCTKILCCARDNIRIKAHRDPASTLATDRYVEKHHRLRR